MIVPLPDLYDVPWLDLSHAYGPAKDTPHLLQQLASINAQASEEAIGWLTASLDHQGMLCDATVAALPFVIRIAANSVAVNRAGVIDFLFGVTISANDIIQSFAIRYERDPAQAEADRAHAVNTREALLPHVKLFQTWQTDDDPAVVEAATHLVDELINAPPPPPPSPPCPKCGKPLRTVKSQQCFLCGADWHA